MARGSLMVNSNSTTTKTTTPQKILSTATEYKLPTGGDTHERGESTVSALVGALY